MSDTATTGTDVLFRDDVDDIGGDADPSVLGAS